MRRGVRRYINWSAHGFGTADVERAKSLLDDLNV